MLLFKDDVGAGITVHAGSIGTVLTNPVSKRYVIRTETSPTQTYPTHGWKLRYKPNEMVLPYNLRDHIVLIRPEFMEFYDIKNSIIYQIGRDIYSVEFPRGFTDYSRGEGISLSSNSIAGGSGEWSEFKHSKGTKMSITGIVSRYEGGKNLIDHLHHIARNGQRENPILFVSEDILAYARIKKINTNPSGPSGFEFDLSLKEVRSKYEGY